MGGSAGRATGSATGRERVPLTIAVRAITPLGATAGAGGDEPCVLVVAADLAAGLPPTVRATRYGPWGDADAGARHDALAIPPCLPPAAIDALANFAPLRRPFWGLDGRGARPIARPEDLIVLVAAVGHDDAVTGATRELAQSTVAIGLAISVGLDRATRVGQLIEAINEALGLPAGDGVGGAQELALTPADLLPPPAGPHVRSLVVGGAGGRYRVEFEFLRG